VLEAGELVGNRVLVLRFTMNARMAKMGVAAALFLGATLAASGAHAQWAVVGAACSPDGIMANSNGFLTCTGGVWVANPIRAGNLSTCDSGNAGYIRWSGSAFEGCNGTSWIRLAGGSIPTYAGLTAATYTASMGGPDGVNAKCAAEFPGSRIMKASEVVYFASSMSTTLGWIFDDGAGGGSTFHGGCKAFSIADSGFNGLVVSKIQLLSTACSAVRNIHCVID